MDEVRPAQAADDRTRVRTAYALIGLSALPFGLYTYNSGYGYDQLEYLIIGRSLLDGYSLYDFVPSKSPGIYLLIALLMRLGLAMTHVQLACVIASVYVLLVTTTFVVARRVWDFGTAAIGAAFVAMCVWFMELNFLQPTGLAYLFGLLAFAFCVRAERGVAPARNWFLCGAMIAIGMQFKSVAAFYGVAAVALLVGGRDLNKIMRGGGAMALGAVLPVGLAVLYFALAGRLHEYWEWTVYFPLVKYPANTVYLSKLYTKLLFFLVLFVGATVCSLLPKVRRAVWGDFATRAAFAFGVISFAALLKTQSSHYCFPGAGFMSLFSARVLIQLSGGVAGAHQLRRVAWVAVPALALMVLSALLYRPSALARLVTLRSFDDEAVFAGYVQRKSPSARSLLALTGGTYAYWASHRYPNWPMVHTHVQTTYYLETHANTLLRLLDDPAVTLVEFNPDNPEFDDEDFLKSGPVRAQVARFRSALERGFRPDPTAPAGTRFWVRAR